MSDRKYRQHGYQDSGEKPQKSFSPQGAPRKDDTYGPRPVHMPGTHSVSRCSQCGTLVEAEYLPPGHPPLHDIELDIAALKEQWKDRKEVHEPEVGPDLALEKVKHGRALHAEHGHKH